MKLRLVMLAICLPAPAFAACDVFLNDREQDALAAMPETAMGAQDAEIELRSGEILRVMVQGGRYIAYHGPQTFSANDIVRVVRIFGRDGRQAYP